MEVRIGDTPGFTWWKGHSWHDLVGLEFLDGEIRVGDAAKEALKKMKEVAGRLRARLGNRKGDPI
jgi:hypothetical protein